VLRHGLQLVRWSSCQGTWVGVMQAGRAASQFLQRNDDAGLGRMQVSFIGLSTGQETGLGQREASRGRFQRGYRLHSCWQLWRWG
jgi:hypothetical protein